MKAVGIILAGGNSKRLKELTVKRAEAAMPIAANYRAIDFALSSMSQSKIMDVAVLAQYNSRSLVVHLSSSKWWDFGRKNGGLKVFTPMITADNAFWYRGTADAIYQNLPFLKKSHEPYVVISSGDGIYKLDFEKVLQYHIEKGADVTIVTKELPEEADVTRFGTVTLDEDNRIREFEEKPIVANSRIVSTGIYIIRKDLLIDLIEEAVEEDRYNLVNDVFMRYRNKLKIYGYPMQGFWRNITSVEDYYFVSKEFLKADMRKYFFQEYPIVRSVAKDRAPAKYNPGSKVSNSLIGNECIINGTVINSVLHGSVYVGNGCVVKDSIIFGDTYLGDNSHIENCIVESHETIRANTTLKGENGPLVVRDCEKRGL